MNVDINKLNDDSNQVAVNEWLLAFTNTPIDYAERSAQSMADNMSRAEIMEARQVDITNVPQSLNGYQVRYVAALARMRQYDELAALA